jgi:hypothetical protein
MPLLVKRKSPRRSIFSTERVPRLRDTLKAERRVAQVENLSVDDDGRAKLFEKAVIKPLSVRPLADRVKKEHLGKSERGEKPL